MPGTTGTGAGVRFLSSAVQGFYAYLYLKLLNPPEVSNFRELARQMDCKL